MQGPTTCTMISFPRTTNRTCRGGNYKIILPVLRTSGEKNYLSEKLSTFPVFLPDLALSHFFKNNYADDGYQNILADFLAKFCEF